MDTFDLKNFPGTQRMKWVSLSYCWGEPDTTRSMKLTKDNKEKLMKGISWKELDPTIQDAVLVTRALGLTYIWIDALCIIQKEEQKEEQNQGAKEWDEEASRMDEIYGGSIVTLVVASSDSVKQGFLNERNPRYIPISLFGGTEYPMKIFLSPEMDDRNEELNWSWNKRGWTMQEGLISRRLLHCTSSQMVWKCGEEQKSETGRTISLNDVVASFQAYSDDTAFGSGWLWKLDTFMKFKRFKSYLPISLDYPLLEDAETFRLWYDLVEGYTQKRFTNIRDRLVAISGLAKIFGNTIGCHEYVAGLWKRDLIRGLLWYCKGAKLIPRISADSIEAVSDGFPSWSWASVGYEVVEFGRKISNDPIVLSGIDDVQIELHDDCLPFGGVKSGSITISRPFKKLPRLYNKDWKSAGASMSEFEKHVSKIVEKENPEGVEDKYSSAPVTHFAAIQMLWATYQLDILMLEATGEVSGGIEEYRRVGVLTLHHFPKNCVASPEVLALVENMGTSLSARLGPQKVKPEKIEGANRAYWELQRSPWETQTIIII